MVSETFSIFIDGPNLVTENLSLMDHNSWLRMYNFEFHMKRFMVNLITECSHPLTNVFGERRLNSLFFLFEMMPLDNGVGNLRYDLLFLMSISGARILVFVQVV
jgi:hypothetical protein